MSILDDRLAERGVLLADGGLGTGLFALGLASGDSPELWNIQHPDRVVAVHRSFIDAGSDVILTNSFGGTRHRLKLHGAQDRVGELNRAAAAFAREAASEAGRPVLVAGSIGPTGELLAPLGPLDPDGATAAFAEQARALAEGGADLLWIETMSAAEEVAAAVEGAKPAGLPIIVTLSFDTNGRTMMGLTPEAAADLCRRQLSGIAAFGANCGVGPAQLLASLSGLRAAAGPEAILVAKGNCGIPEYQDGRIAYSGTVELMSEYAVLARDAGARIIGGCCGTTAAHLAAMRGALDRRQQGPCPDLGLIERALGPIVLPERGVGAPARERRRRRG